MTSLEFLEEIKKEKAYKIIWEHIKSHPDNVDLQPELINQIGELFNLTNFNYAGLKIDRLLHDLLQRCQIRYEGNKLLVLGDRYMSNSDFNSWLLNGRNKMNSEANTNETTFNISTETANDFASIREQLKNRMGINLTNDQVIQHLFHSFKMMNPQGMPQQPFLGPNLYSPMKPPIYPPGVRCANPSQSTGINFDEEMKKRQ